MAVSVNIWAYVAVYVRILPYMAVYGRCKLSDPRVLGVKYVCLRVLVAFYLSPILVFVVVEYVLNAGLLRLICPRPWGSGRHKFS